MMARVPLTTEPVVSSRVVVNVENIVLTPEQFFRLCRDNPELRLELTAQKELIIMSPTGSRTGSQNMELSFQIQRWTIQDGGGIAFDSSTGFLLPNGATRSPDASWIRPTRWDALAAEDQQRFAPICPDFVVELRSPGDAIDDLETKMMEYIANGAQLGFLIDCVQLQVVVYRPSAAPERFDNPRSISGDPVLPGFTLDLTKIWKLVSRSGGWMQDAGVFEIERRKKKGRP